MSVEGQNVEQIRIDLIIEGDRVRLLNPARVMQLADSIDDQDLIHPITVRPDATETGYVLVSGGHRLAAAKVLGWKTIPANVRKLTDEEALQIEVEENLLREDLPALDRALHLAARKSSYEAEFPETKHGHNRVDNVVNSPRPRRFTAKMADELGVGERDIQRAIEIANAITPDLHAEIHGTPLADNQAQLLKLAARPPEDRAALVRTMKDRGVYKVEAARRLQAGIEEPAPLPLEEAWQRKMRALWAGGKKAWQRRFLLAIDAQFAAPEDGDN